MCTKQRVKRLSGRLLSLPVQLILRFTIVAILTAALWSQTHQPRPPTLLHLSRWLELRR